MYPYKTFAQKTIADPTRLSPIIGGKVRKCNIYSSIHVPSSVPTGAFSVPFAFIRMSLRHLHILMRTRKGSRSLVGENHCVLTKNHTPAPEQDFGLKKMVMVV
jgi:hypothetical protein